MRMFAAIRAFSMERFRLGNRDAANIPTDSEKQASIPHIKPNSGGRLRPVRSGAAFGLFRKNAMKTYGRKTTVNTLR